MGHLFALWPVLPHSSHIVVSVRGQSFRLWPFGSRVPLQLVRTVAALGAATTSTAQHRAAVIGDFYASTTGRWVSKLARRADARDDDPIRTVALVFWTREAQSAFVSRAAAFAAFGMSIFGC
jgi:hypothetical protein